VLEQVYKLQLLLVVVDLQLLQVLNIMMVLHGQKEQILVIQDEQWEPLEKLIQQL
jgi:hypothetical protein